MSRIPQPSSSRTLKPPSTPIKSKVSSGTTPDRARTQSGVRAAAPVKSKAPEVVPPTPAAPQEIIPLNRTAKVSPGSTPARARTQSGVRAAAPVKSKAPEVVPPRPAAHLSIKEIIALKRVEAKKGQTKAGSGSLDDFVNPEDALPDVPRKQEEDDILGRLSVRETIEKARNTGSLNLSTRSLPCLPSALFEIHLGVNPDPLKSVPNEPALPPSEPPKASSRRGNYDNPSWFQAQDLTVLKAWNNEIEEIQHEISLFGSLKTVDLHKNKLASLPTTFADLTALTVLDLSHNSLIALPEKLFALPELTTLNLSHNLLVGLPFNAPFATGDGRSRSNQYTSGIFFTPAVARANTSLPHLVALDASYNRISASAIDETIPVSLTKIDLSGNPLGPSQSLLRNLASLKRLKELKLEKSEIGDDSFPSTLFSIAPFPNLRLLDVSETQVNLEPLKVALKLVKQELNFDFTTEDPPEGAIRVLVGKRIIKEPWELELERRAKARAMHTTSFTDDWTTSTPPQPSNDQSSTTKPISVSKTTADSEERVVKAQNKPGTEVVKEAWEIEAEQGLLTEGGRRRARAAAVAAAQSQNRANIGQGMPSSTNPPSPPPLSPGSGLNNPQYFTSSTQTLRLPPSVPPAKSAGHSRAFSLAVPTSALSSGPARTGDISVPTPTLPLAVIITQPFAQTLRVLILANRRMDRSFALPSSPGSISGFLPCLEELDLEGCNLTDLVTVYPDSSSGRTTPPRSTEPILLTLAKLFPSLQILNLSYNALTNISLTSEALSTLIFTSPHRKGLRHLGLRGNKFSELDGFMNLAESFKGNRNVPGWKMEELDLRDNEISKLPPELGLLPLDVLLVDGNIFRVPQRRVWEREGTKGLLSWLRGRIE